MVRVYRIIERTQAEGPGVRFCIWVQGCSHQCSGCFATDTWGSHGGMVYETSAIITAIRRNAAYIEGITLLGGEPFEQATELAVIAEATQAIRLSVMTFTGYTHETLVQSHDDGVARLIASTDLLIDGQYVEALRDFSRPWVGSSNQRFIFLTNRYNMDMIGKYKNRIEARIEKNGAISLNGMGDCKDIEQLIKLCMLARGKG
jgi:anaerobic ribonucleoside-triphosphate reductase activating protein